MSSDDQFKYAKSQMMNADMKLRGAKESLKGDLSKYNYPDIVLESQQCIELYVKAMMKSIGVNPPTEHAIGFSDDETRGLLEHDFPEDFDQHNKIPRAVFLTTFWSEFYQLSKYRSNERNIPPGDILIRDDAELAIHHAQFCKELCHT